MNLLRGLGPVALGGVLALGDAGRLAAAVAQVIELGAPDLAAAHDLDRVDHRRIEREDALDALAVGDLADGEAFLEAGAGAGDAHALIGLHAGALALLDLDVDDQGVAGLEVRHVPAELLDLLAVELLEDVHGSMLLPWRASVSGDSRARISASCCELPALYRSERSLSTRLLRPHDDEG